jgi:clan AA aspartic protease
MIAGSINFSRQATIPVAMMNNNNRQYAQIHSIIDTGFDGDLQLPSQEIARLGLPLVGTIMTELADGSVVESGWYEATVLWLGQPVEVKVLASNGTIPLVGTNLLWGSVMSVAWEFGGRVTIAPLLQPE